MSSLSPTTKARKETGNIKVFTERIETDPEHHLAGPFLPQTPFDDSTTPGSTRSSSPSTNRINGSAPVHKSILVAQPEGFWYDIKTLRWVVVPSSAFKLLIVPVILYLNWEALALFVAPDLSNPFSPLLFISYPIEDSSPGDRRYGKGYLDLIFIAYHVIFFSFIRQTVTLKVCRPVARYFGIKKQAKLDRFGEQGYALVYFTVMGCWGFSIMAQLPTWWYRTEYFWIDYPHWDMNPQLKRYYLMQSSYWCQQLIVLLLGLEKPRKDYVELVAHHIVTLWMVGWSYLMNMTLIGNAVYLSMDIPDSFLAFSKILNYLQFDRAKVVAFVTFIVVWTYFRHWLNIMILYSVWGAEFDAVPIPAKQWNPPQGVWLAWWVRHQIMFAIGALQILNLFWYWLIMRILVRSITTKETTDERSDDEDEVDDDKED